MHNVPVHTDLPVSAVSISQFPSHVLSRDSHSDFSNFEMMRHLLLFSTCVTSLRLLRSTSALRSVSSSNLGPSATPNLSHHHQDVSLRRRLPRLLRIHGRDPQWPPVLHTRVLPRLRHVQTPQVWLWWLVLSFAVLRSRADWPLHEQCVHSSKAVYPERQVSQRRGTWRVLERCRFRRLLTSYGPSKLCWRWLSWIFVWLRLRHRLPCWGSAGYAGQFRDGKFPLFPLFSDRAASSLRLPHRRRLTPPSLAHTSS